MAVVGAVERQEPSYTTPVAVASWDHLYKWVYRIEQLAVQIRLAVVVAAVAGVWLAVTLLLNCVVAWQSEG